MNKKQIILLSVIISLVILMIIISLFFRRHIMIIIEFFEEIIKYALEQNIFVTIAIFIALEFPFYVLFLPGDTLIVAIAAYFIKDFLKTFFIFAIAGLVLNVMAYVIYSLFKEKLVSWVEDEKLYKIFKNKTEKNQWQISFMVHMMYIPRFYKTFVLIVLNVGFWEYNIPANIVNWILITLFISLGTSVNTIQDLYNGNDKEQKDVRIVLMLISGIFLISLLIFIYMIIFAYTEYKLYEIDYEKEQKNNEKQLKLRDMENKTQIELDDQQQQEDKIF